jgi:hypothetical protein
MRHHSWAAAAAGVLAAAALLAPGLAAAPEPAPQGPALPSVKWKLEGMNKGPFELLTATPDPQNNAVQFVINFTRDVRLSELLDWESGGGPIVFRFLDKDGVVIRTVKPRLDGELIPEKGAHIRLVLPLPDQGILDRTLTIVAHPVL